MLKGFDTFELVYNFRDIILQIGSQIWSSDKVDLNLYQPADR